MRKLWITAPFVDNFCAKIQFSLYFFGHFCFFLYLRTPDCKTVKQINWTISQFHHWTNDPGGKANSKTN